jgi:hypothetical protein
VVFQIAKRSTAQLVETDQFAEHVIEFFYGHTQLRNIFFPHQLQSDLRPQITGLFRDVIRIELLVAAVPRRAWHVGVARKSQPLLIAHHPAYEQTEHTIHTLYTGKLT